MRYTMMLSFLLIVSSARAQSGPPARPGYAVAPVSQLAASIDFQQSVPIQIDFAGTWLRPKAHGEGQVTGDHGRLHIHVQIKNLGQASDLGPAYLTYVLWAASPGGQIHNLGEVLLTGAVAAVAATTDLDAFAMFVTAEPYYAVTEPSEAVVLKNVSPNVALRYRPAPDLLPLLRDRQTPLDLVQARNAVRIARRLGAERLASGALQKAVGLLSEAEEQYRGDDRWQTVLKAREATEAAEAARLLAARAEAE